MIRLGAMLLATLVGVFALLAVFGDGNLRAARQPDVTKAPRPAAQDAAADAILPQPAEEPVVQAPVVEAQTQTPQRVREYPGPALEPSPEYAGGETPVPAAALAGTGGPVLYVAADRVNMRQGPSTNDRVVGSLTSGAAVEALGPADAEWVNIRDAEGRTGYVAGRFLAVNPN